MSLMLSSYRYYRYNLKMLRLFILKQKSVVLFCLFLIGFTYSLSAQLESPRIEVVQINDSTILDLFLIAYTSRDMRTQVGLSNEYRSTFGISWMDGWPLYELSESPNQENITCQAFRKHYDNYSVWIKGYGINTASPSWLMLDSTMTIIEELPIAADNHGLDIDKNGKILYSEKEFSMQSFLQFGWLDTLTITGNTKSYNPDSGADSLLVRFLDLYTTDLVLDEYKNQGNFAGAFDWTHNNDNRVTRINDLIVNDRHLGARLIRGDSVLFWIGINDSLAIANNLNVLEKANADDYELKLAHNGREVPVGVFSPNDNPDSLYVSFFDNGTAERGYSRVIVYGIDLINQSHSIIFEQQFPYTPFAGSVEFLPDNGGMYLVNIPLVPDSFFVWIQTQEVDSIMEHISELGNQLYLMNLSGDTLASFQSIDGNLIYQAELLNKNELFDSWPEVVCINSIEDDYLLSVEGAIDSVEWYTIDNVLLGNNNSIEVPDGQYYYTFQYGITTGYSRLFHTGVCLTNTSQDFVASNATPLVYPNPVKSTVNFHLSSGNIFDEQHIKIYDLSGRLLKSQLLIGTYIDVSEFSSGTYYFTISTDLGLLTKGRFVKIE